MTIVTGGYETDKKQEKGENKLLFYINLILAQLGPACFIKCVHNTNLYYIQYEHIYVLFLLFNFSLIDIIFHKCRQLISSIVHRGRHKKEKHKNLGNVPIRHDPPTHSDDSDIFSKSQPPSPLRPNSDIFDIQNILTSADPSNRHLERHNYIGPNKGVLFR